MAQLYCTGPAHSFVQYGSARPLYLGTCKISPQIEIKKSTKAVYNDLGGEVPFDVAYMGKEAMTVVDLTRWNEKTYETIASSPQQIFGGGTDGPLDIGSLYLTEGLGFTFYVVFPFATQKKAYSTLPAGYRFPGSYLVGPEKHQQMGTHPKELLLMFHHLRLFNAATGAFLLYDSNMAAVNNIPLV